MRPWAGGGLQGSDAARKRSLGYVGACMARLERGGRKTKLEGLSLASKIDQPSTRRLRLGGALWDGHRTHNVDGGVPVPFDASLITA